MEIGAEKEIKRKQLEVEALKITSSHTHASSDRSLSLHTLSNHKGFDVSKNISLVPAFCEAEVDLYFSAFKRIASGFHWPRDMWPVLLKCKLVGKAQEVVSSLSLEDSLQYDVVKEAIFRAYELLPEADRQKFRNHRTSGGQNFVEFVREKNLPLYLDKWCAAIDVKTDFEALRQLIILEDFKGSLPEKVVLFLNEQTVSTSRAAVFSDGFVLTHKNVFSSSPRSDRPSTSRPTRAESNHLPLEKARGPLLSQNDSSECFYCHKRGLHS